MEIRGQFIEYIKCVENGGKAGFQDGTWYPHKSPEGGNDTIGYGHKLLDSEEWMQKGVSDDEIEKLLIHDILNACDGASNVISKYASGDFDSLPQNCKEMFTDFVFNLGANGLRKFPKFVAAAIDNDTETMHKEYKRYYRNGCGEVKELEHRNSEFYQMFL